MFYIISTQTCACICSVPSLIQGRPNWKAVSHSRPTLARKEPCDTVPVQLVPYVQQLLLLSFHGLLLLGSQITQPHLLQLLLLLFKASHLTFLLPLKRNRKAGLYHQECTLLYDLDWDRMTCGQCWVTGYLEAPHFLLIIFLSVSFWRHKSWPTRMGVCWTVSVQDCEAGATACQHNRLQKDLHLWTSRICAYAPLCLQNFGNSLWSLNPSSLVNNFLFSRLIWKSKCIFFFKTKLGSNDIF